MNDIDALHRRIVSVEARQHAVLKELLQWMLGQRSHGAGLHIRGQARFNADLMFGQVVHQGRILYRFDPMTDALRAQLADGLPDTFRSGRFASVDGNMPASVAGLIKMVEEQRAREAQLITGQIQRGDALAVGEQRRQLFLTGRFTEGAAQNADQAGVDLKIAAAFTYARDHRLYYAVDRKLMGHRHIAGREAQLNVVQAIARGVFDVLVCHATAGFQ